MPYVEPAKRELAAELPTTPGELTYAIQQLLKTYLAGSPGESYWAYAECLGALRGAELDLWDRKIQPYEVSKREQNGDVW